MASKKKSLKNDFVDFLLEDDFPHEDEETTAITTKEDLKEEDHPTQLVDTQKEKEEDHPTQLVDTQKEKEDDHPTQLVETQKEKKEKKEEGSFGKAKEKIANLFQKNTEENKTAIIQKESRPIEEGSLVAGDQTSFEKKSSSLKVEQAQALQVAQNKIDDLESLNSNLEFELSELRSSGEVLYRQNQDLKTQVESLQQKIKNLKESYESEKKHLQDKTYNKDKQIEDYKLKMESLKLQLKVDFQKVKSRERELENRLHIIKMENQAILRSKDEMILELKRNIDELNLEMENYKDKGRGLHVSFENTKEKMRKSVKALRLAINLLETDDEENEDTDSKKESA